MSDSSTAAPAAPFKFSISAAAGDVESDALKVINKIHGWILDEKADNAAAFGAVQTLESYVKSVYTLFTVHKAETASALPGIATGLSGLIGGATGAGAVTAAAQSAQAQGSVGAALLKVSGLDELGLLGAGAASRLKGWLKGAETDTLAIKQRLVSDFEATIEDAKAELERMKFAVADEIDKKIESSALASGAAQAQAAPATTIEPAAPAPAPAPAPVETQTPAANG